MIANDYLERLMNTSLFICSMICSFILTFKALLLMMHLGSIWYVLLEGL